MTDILWNLASFIVALGVLVAVHEFGHFWVARKCGVQVLKFSIGFGKSLWSKTGKDGTEYSIAIIPLGGYVKMLDGRVDDITEQEKSQAFNHKKLWQRAAIISAGPVFNFVFALFAYWVVFLIGVPAVKPVIGQVTPHSIVAQAGIETGMELKAVSGIKTADWESVNMQLISHIGDDLMTLTVTSDDAIGVEQVKKVDIRDWSFDPEKESPMSTLGFVPFRPEVSTTLAHIGEGGAAEKAGLQVGDVILAANGNKITDWQQMVEVIRSNANTPVSVTVDRVGQTVKLELIPDSKQVSDGKSIGFAGIAPEVAEWPENYRFELKYGVFESIGKAVDKTGQIISLTFSMLKKLVVGDVGIENLSGPISIAKGAGATADYGLVYFLSFMALISVNLGIINLLPLPVLDGGHLLFLAIEAVIRRPVPEAVQEVGYRIGGAIIMSLMVVALFNDFTRL
ncbi:sigma E protease regulator RseP [Vibrio tapetis subsp. quintayensis]|uniref:sigma E protease regulator RseP n=1 Tax=Vibrio tapetis TaxID=52443 RepID=UPI0025B58A14|nr:sigma E protease regulator RseP [Vibrio tapetis]MDN3682709.1 sigma E protease regulator RseP [Vibrio tapetis subsp. quintayensis]